MDLRYFRLEASQPQAKSKGAHHLHIIYGYFLNMAELIAATETIRPTKLQWNHGVLTTGLPGKSLHFKSIILNVLWSWQKRKESKEDKYELKRRILGGK